MLASTLLLLQLYFIFFSHMKNNEFLPLPFEQMNYMLLDTEDFRLPF